MNRTIWTCWFQGRASAPKLVERCLRSWERNNPGWDFRCLDATTIPLYLPLGQHVDLERQLLTAASLSDILRVLLLQEFGGVWVDATLFCNRPLDEWLPDVMGGSFFAFAKPAPDRPLSSWFLSAAPKNYLVPLWAQRTVDYWANRQKSEDYFWFHHLFREMCDEDPLAAAAWSRVPEVRADGPHVLQLEDRMFRPASELIASIDWTTPVFKLTHRVPEVLPTGCLLEHLLDRESVEAGRPVSTRPEPGSPALGPEPTSFASLRVSTENLGDHIQIISGLGLLDRLGIEPTHYIDRDDEIHSAPSIDDSSEAVGILLNGWFKTNRTEWPPHPKLVPLIIGFHIRLFQCPELVSKESIEFFRRHQPIGCRDVATESLLRDKGVTTFTSNCLSLTLPRRIEGRRAQSETFVVSRDERIKESLPSSLIPYTFISHYSGSRDFEENMSRANALLETYRSRAKLIVTTLLHCALPAIAMGIPVVVFYPINSADAHVSDRERFSSLEKLVPVYSLDEINSVDWRPEPVDVSLIKLAILDRFYEMTVRWRIPRASPLGPIAPSSVLPVP